ncbi:putative lipoprotein NlpC [Sporomusaceae bacterium BoRhaA]|uniref:C40 family peptidase n=1 Tax=Pelorhabdus rhamnosifermentans TaxID=2772457 RepID=UPI001C06003E|nr:NlpC/P60 family protein [Pelorhabdus rhamnosifermentans]MBU2703868.1 putative lipoprotein NlpC [Pelorhabdus rhamnosifermentans]
MENFDDLISLPFADGGRGPFVYDCWGLVREVYRRYGVNLPDYPISAMDAVKIGEQMTQDRPEWVEINGPIQTPCLVVIRLACGSWANHVGVYIGDGQFIHAYRTTGVAVDKIKKWRSSIVGFYIPRG